jgi:hypothetical protein
VSLDVYLEAMKPTEVYWANYTHNCSSMAAKAGIYKHLWHPEEVGVTKAKQLIAPLTAGIKRLKANPAAFRKINPPNGWGSYDTFLPFVEKYLEACKENPDADVRVSV